MPTDSSSSRSPSDIEPEEETFEESNQLSKPTVPDPSDAETNTARPQAKRRSREKSNLIVQHDYHDYASVETIDLVTSHAMAKPANRRGQRNGTYFPIQLHKMLEATNREGLADIVSWSDHGRAFIVHRPTEFSQKVLPRFFKQHKYTSFQRQLNLYGFLRLSKGADNGGYYHELFLRGKPELALAMKRVKVKGTFKKPKRNPDQEPDFASMEPVGLLITSLTPSSSTMESNERLSDNPSSSIKTTLKTEKCVEDLPCQQAKLEVTEINSLIKERTENSCFGLPISKREKKMPYDAHNTTSTCSKASVNEVTQDLDARAFGGVKTSATPEQDRMAVQKRVSVDYFRPSSATSFDGTSEEAASLSTRTSRGMLKQWKKRPIVFSPNCNDVLCHRGGDWIESRPGYCHYREALERRRQDYCLAASKCEKARVSREVVDYIHRQNPPGRFLQRIDGIAHRNEAPEEEASSLWVELDDVDARYLTSQAFRECSSPDIQDIGESRSSRNILASGPLQVSKDDTSTVEGAQQLVLLSSIQEKPDCYCFARNFKDVAPALVTSGTMSVAGKKGRSDGKDAGVCQLHTPPSSSSAFEDEKHLPFTSFTDPLNDSKMKTIQDWLIDAVPYMSQDDVHAYSKHLFENGFDSVQILEEYLLAEDLDFMKTAHRRALVAAKITKRREGKEQVKNH